MQPIVAIEGESKGKAFGTALLHVLLACGDKRVIARGKYPPHVGKSVYCSTCDGKLISTETGR